MAKRKRSKIKVEEYKARSLTEMMDGIGSMAVMLGDLKDDPAKYFALGVLSAMTAKSEARKEAG